MDLSRCDLDNPTKEIAVKFEKWDVVGWTSVDRGEVEEAVKGFSFGVDVFGEWATAGWVTLHSPVDRHRLLNKPEDLSERD